MRIMRSEHVFIGMAGVNSFMGLGFKPQPQEGWRSQSTIWQNWSSHGHIDVIRSIEDVGQNR
jgi:hypothetical protein